MSASRSAYVASVSTTWVSERADVGREGGPAPGRVQADQHLTAQRRRAEQERELGGVVEQHTDVWRAPSGSRSSKTAARTTDSRTTSAQDQLRSSNSSPGTLVIRPREQLGANGGCHAGSAARARPIVRACSVAPPNENSKRLALVK